MVYRKCTNAMFLIEKFLIEMSTTLRWGDFPIIRDTESGIAAIEREQMTKPRPLEVEGPLLYQPSPDHIPSTKRSISFIFVKLNAYLCWLFK